MYTSYLCASAKETCKNKQQHAKPSPVTQPNRGEGMECLANGPVDGSLTNNKYSNCTFKYLFNMKIQKSSSRSLKKYLVADVSLTFENL